MIHHKIVAIPSHGDHKHRNLNCVQTLTSPSKLRALFMTACPRQRVLYQQRPPHQPPLHGSSDDAHATQAKSRLYQDLIEEIVYGVESKIGIIVNSVLKALSATGKFAVAFLRYETGAELQQITERSSKHQAYSRILIFNRLPNFRYRAGLAFLQNLAGSSVAGVRDIHANIDQNEFRQAIQKIRDFIAAGDTYQVNFTYRLHFRSYGSAAALYLALRQRQPVPYGAFATNPNGETILSFSPELFPGVTSQGTLLARPMKGTAAPRAMTNSIR